MDSEPMELDSSSSIESTENFHYPADAEEKRFKFYSEAYRHNPLSSEDSSIICITRPNEQNGITQDEYCNFLSSEVTHHPFETDIELITPILNSTPSQECPNVWWYRRSSQGILTKFNELFSLQMKTRTSDTIDISTKDQLVLALFAHFSLKGLKQCTAPCCKAFQNEIRKVIAVCRWENLREAMITMVACWRCILQKENELKQNNRHQSKLKLLIIEKDDQDPNSNTGQTAKREWELDDFNLDFPREACVAHENIFPYIIGIGVQEEDQGFIMEIMSLMNWFSAISEPFAKEINGLFVAFSKTTELQTGY